MTTANGATRAPEPRWVVDFSPATVLYRRACAMAKQARVRADQFEHSRKNERRLREIDATIETVILTQGAAEGWIYSAYRSASVAPKARANWREVWTLAIASINPELERGLDLTTVQTLEWISAWRNYLVHDDNRARRMFKNTIGVEPHVTLLNAGLAAAVIDRMDAAFCDVGAAIGSRSISAPNSAHLWVAADEN